MGFEVEMRSALLTHKQECFAKQQAALDEDRGQAGIRAEQAFQIRDLTTTNRVDGSVDDQDTRALQHFLRSQELGSVLAVR